MNFRQGYSNETIQLFEEGYKVWSKNRTFEQYCLDNGKEDAFGTRYVIEHEGNIASSLILLRLGKIFDHNVYGIGSVLTFPLYKGYGYATELIKRCLQLVEDDAMIFLYSEISSHFYERFHFRALPEYLQKDSDSICMVLCSEELWNKLLDCNIDLIPEHF